MKKIISVFFLVTGMGVSLAAQSYTDVSLQPGGAIPLETVLGQDSLYEVGLAVTLATVMGAENFPLYFGIDVDYLDASPRSSTMDLSLISISAGTGLSLKLSNFMTMRIGGYGGGYAGILSRTDGTSDFLFNPSAKGQLNLAFHLGPIFTLGFGAEYLHYFTKESQEGPLTAFYQGLGASLTLSIRSGGAGSSSNDLLPGTPIINPVFPVFYKYYKDHPLGSLSVKNETSKPIEDLSLSFYVNRLMDAPYESQKIAVLEPGEEKEIDIKALFNDNLMGLTEGTTTACEIVLNYTQKGKPITKSIASQVIFYDRNAMTWDDDRKAASFVTTRDTAIMSFSRAVAGVVRDKEKSPVNTNLRIGMGIFEALKEYGLSYAIDPRTPYTDKNQTSIDYLQFPRQTLEYRAGDCDDLSILYCALLESVGIESAFITVPGHIYVAFGLDISEREMRKTFQSPQEYIVKDDKVWVPVEITQVQSGFLKAWKTGAKEWREHNPAERAGFYPVREAWESYVSVGLPGAGLSLSLPSRDSLFKVYKSALESFIEKEIEKESLRLTKIIEQSKGAPRDVNKLGVLYAQYGLYDKAKEVFEELSDKHNYLPAMTNMGNLCFMLNDLSIAEEWYERILKQRPDNAKVLLGLARVSYQKEDYGKVEYLYAKIKYIDRSLAEKYAYLSSPEDAGSRASAVEDVSMLWAEDEDFEE